MTLVKLTRRYQSSVEKNPDANFVWVNKNHIVMMHRKLDGWGGNLETEIRLLDVDDSISVLEHPDVIMARSNDE